MTTAIDPSIRSVRLAAAPIPLGPRIRIWPPVVLAPMAGVTNYPYRRICREQGAGLCVSEMISSRGVLEGGQKTWRLAWFGPDERPRSIQIFGCKPHEMAESARILRGELGVDHVDINFGCPVKKITKRGMGAAAFLDLDNCRRLVRDVVRAVDPIPVTIKVRVGMDEDRLTFREAGRIAEGEGCAYIALHGRTAQQMYSGKARWELIGELKEALTIPVLGNGDIFAAPDAFRMMEKTGCDGVVIGRGCLGNPWLFKHLKMLFDGEGIPQRPSLVELVRLIREHYQLLLDHNSDCPKLAALQLRKFGSWYVRGIRGSSQLRAAFQHLETREDLERILELVAEGGLETGVPDPSQPTRDATP
jgi:nifR3 family TIM-barrel protein